MDRCYYWSPPGIHLGSPSFFNSYQVAGDNLLSSVKLFVDDTPLFLVIHNFETSADELNNDSYKINNYFLQWKLRFNPKPSK